MATNELNAKVYQVALTLKGSEPNIWRRIQIESDFDLQEFHYVIQLAMGWNDLHFFSFKKDGLDYSYESTLIDQDGEEFEFTDLLLEELLKKENQKAEYYYGWTKQWKVEIVVERILPYDSSVVYPFCMDGALASPPEDCPSIERYYEALQEYKNTAKDSPNYQENIERFGENFDAEKFDLAQLNEALKPEDFDKN